MEGIWLSQTKRSLFVEYIQQSAKKRRFRKKKREKKKCPIQGLSETFKKGIKYSKDTIECTS